MNPWEKKFTDLGAFWFHDGNPKRPYARLTSEKISNGFFNGGKVCEHPDVLADAVGSLCDIIGSVNNILGEQVHVDIANLAGKDTYVVGPAMGGITLAHEFARQLKARLIYAEKEKDGSFALKRFDPPHPGSRVLIVEDTITTGGSALKVSELISRVAPQARISNYVLALVNRSESDYIGSSFRILPVIRRPMQSWDEGKNPFTPDGKELVEPVKPKANWDALTRKY